MRLLALLFFLLLALRSATAHAEPLSGRVTYVADGDTLTLTDAKSQQHQIRLAGIDAPEAMQDFGQQAKTGLAALAFGQPATAQCSRRDTPPRLLCVVSIAGQDIGLALVGQGMAWSLAADTTLLDAQQRADYGRAELNAKMRRFGLWNSKNPVPPWNWPRGLAED